MSNVPQKKEKRTNDAKEDSRSSGVAAEDRQRTATQEIEPSEYTLDIGRNLVTTVRGIVFDIEGLGFLGIQNVDHPLIDGALYDENGLEAIKIEKNIYALSSDVWDIEYVGKTLTFRNAPRNIFAKLVFDAENQTISLRANFTLRDELQIRITDTGIFANQFRLAAENMILNSEVGIFITSEVISLPAIVTRSSVHRSIFSQMNKIAVLNAMDCCNNLFHGCTCCFAWSTQFLERLVPTARS